MSLNLYFYEIYDIILERKRIGVDRVKHEVKCRLCGQYFDAQLDGLDTVYVMPARNYYYHKTCYDNWKKANLNEDEQWRDRIYDYLAHDLKIKYDFFKCEAFFKSFIKSEKKGTYKGCYFALKYFYEIQGGDREKSYGGLGIIPYVYAKSTEYWSRKEQENRGIVASIEEEIKKREELRAKAPSRTAKKEKVQVKPKWNLEDIE